MTQNIQGTQGYKRVSKEEVHQIHGVSRPQSYLKSVVSEPGDQVQEMSYPCACQGRFIHQVLSHVLFGD